MTTPRKGNRKAAPIDEPPTIAEEAGLVLVDSVAKASPDASQAEAEDYTNHQLRMALQNSELDRKRARRDMKLRKEYAGKAYALAAWGVWFWMGTFAVYGVVKGFWGVEIFSDAIMMSITAGATINVAAAFLGVIRGLFPVTHAVPLSGRLPAAKPRPATKRATSAKSSPDILENG